MKKHTEGPWEWNDQDQLVAVNVLREPYFDDEEGIPMVIIETDGGAYPPCDADRPLLAASPDMLAALEAILPFCAKTSASEGGAAMYSASVAAADLVRAAIAKATQVNT